MRGQLEHAADEDVQGNQVYRLRVMLAGEAYILEAGDFLFYQADLDHSFENLSNGPCEYFIVIDSTRLR